MDFLSVMFTAVPQVLDQCLAQSRRKINVFLSGRVHGAGSNLLFRLCDLALNCIAVA